MNDSLFAAQKLANTYYQIHPNGVIVEYVDYSFLPRKKKGQSSSKDRVQEKVGNKKMKLADAAVTLVKTATNKVLLLTLTCPVMVDAQTGNKYVRNFFNNINQEHSWKDKNKVVHKWKRGNYFWVLEYTKKGRPHWHVAIDIPFVPMPILSRAFSRQFGQINNYCVRLHNKERRFLVDYGAFCWYLTKYFAKSAKARELELRENRKRGKKNKNGLHMCQISDGLQKLIKIDTVSAADNPDFTEFLHEEYNCKAITQDIAVYIKRK